VAKISLIQGIQEYARATDSLGIPASELEKQKFEEYLAEHNIRKDSKLNLNSLRKIANEINAKKLKSSITFYTRLAKAYGIEYYDTGDDAETDLSTHVDGNNNDVEADNRDGQTQEIDVENKPNQQNKRRFIECYLKRRCWGVSIRATGILNMDGTLIVLKGSGISTNEVDLRHVVNTRDKYREFFKDGVLTDDILCSSPSSAAIVVIGNSANGWTEWKDQKGNPIKVYQELIEELKETYDCTLEEYTNVSYEEEGTLEDSTETIENISDIEGEEAEMTPEEMIAKGLAGMMLQNRNATIEIGQETLKNIQSMLCKEQEKTSKFTWSTGHNIEETFENSIHGYDFNELKQILDIKRSMLLRGVPGTGKTKIMKLLINQLAEGDKSRYKIISFSQGTDYTDFIGGLVSKNGNWEYKDGILTELCKLADKHRENNYYLGIDEVSRGNTEAIFGELMTCIEHRDTIVTLKNGDEFMIPSNLYIIGTMNSLDGSTKKIDVATLERFYIVDIVPQWKDYAYALTKDIEVTDELFTILDNICICMEQINELIENSKELGPDKCIGTRAVSGIKLTKENLKIAVESHLIPEINDRIKYCRSNKNDIEDLKKEIQKLFE